MDKNKETTPAQPAQPLAENREARVRLYPSQKHVDERFEYAGQVARSADEAIEVNQSDVQSLLDQGFSRDPQADK